MFGPTFSTICSDMLNKRAFEEQSSLGDNVCLLCYGILPRWHTKNWDTHDFPLFLTKLNPLLEAPFPLVIVIC